MEDCNLCSECLLNYRFTLRIDRFRFTQTSFPVYPILYKVRSEVCFLYYYFSVYCNLFKELFLYLLFPTLQLFCNSVRSQKRMQR